MIFMKIINAKIAITIMKILLRRKIFMKKVIGGVLVGAGIGFISSFKLLSYAIGNGCNRGPIIHEDDNMIIKRCKTSDGKLMPMAWITDKKSEK